MRFDVLTVGTLVFKDVTVCSVSEMSYLLKKASASIFRLGHTWTHRFLHKNGKFLLGYIVSQPSRQHFSCITCFEVNIESVNDSR
jgi:hypothetical protein